jgi:hypothetical protein
MKGSTSPFKGTHYSFSFAQGGTLRSELYIDVGDAEENRELFSALYEDRATIEADYGHALHWEELPDRRACRVADYTSGDVKDEDASDVHIDWFFDSGARLRKAMAAAAERMHR